MEMILIATFSISILTFLLIFFFLHHHRRPATFPPGRTGLPLIGETLDILWKVNTKNTDHFIDHRVNRFGPVFLTHVFGEPTIYSVDPDLNRFILNNEGKLFESDYPSMIAYLHGEYSLLIMKGKLHKKMHSLVVNFINSGLVRGKLLSDLDHLMRFYMDSWSSKVVLWEETKKITFALTMKLLLGVDPSEWTEGIKKEFLYIINGLWSIPLPFLSTSYKRAVKAKANVVKELSIVVSKRRSEMGEGEIKEDILGAILEESGNEGLSDEMVVDLLVSLLLAGFETTSSAMTLSVKCLTESPLALAQLKDEQEKIRSEKGDKERVVWNDYKSMPFTQFVVSESLRIANIVGGVFRRTMSDVKLNEYTIPKGWKVFVALRGTHLRDELIKDARSFDPWRWQSGKGANPGIVMPFGGGPRLCPGYELSKVSMSVFLHHLVTKFRWETAEEDELVHFPMTGMKKGYPIFVHRRN